MAGVVIDELVTLIGVGVQADAWANIKKMKDGLSGIVEGAAKLAAGFAAAAVAGLYAADRFNRSTAELGKLSDATGISSESFQKWGYAVQQVGGDSKTIQNDLVSLTRTMSSPVIGEYSNELAMMGVNVYDAAGNLRTADKVARDLVDALQGLPAQTQMQWTSKLGLSQDFLLLAQKGGSVLDKYFDMAQGDFGIVSDSTINNAREFTKDMDRLGRIVTNLGSNIAANLSPKVKELVDKFAEFVNTHKDEIIKFFQNFMDTALDTLTRVVSWLKDNKQWFIDFFQGIMFVIQKTTAALKALKDFSQGKLGKQDGPGYGETAINEKSWMARKFGKKNDDDERPWYQRVKEGILGTGEAEAAEIPKEMSKLSEETEDLSDETKEATEAINNLTATTRDISAPGSVQATSLSGAVTQPQQGMGQNPAGSAPKPVSTSKIKSSGDFDSKMKHAMDFYTSQGLSKDEAAAIVGNLSVESHLNTGATGDKNKPQHSWAHGIGQWRDNEDKPGTGRFTDLQKFAASRGTSWEDYDTQLAFVLWEMQNTEKGAGGKFKSASGMNAKVAAMGKYYERPKDLSQSINERTAYAEKAAQMAPTINITQNIQGSDPNAIAAKSAEKIDTSLQAHFAGGNAPMVQ